jgi:hypothetical protein
MYRTHEDRLYARVSTTDQSCEMQLRELRDYAVRRGLKVTEEYVDTGWSGTKTSRPELDRLMRDARLRCFDIVLVWKLDRWGRSVVHCIRSIQELVSLGIRFLAATQNIDTDETNPTSQFILHIFAAVAELGKRDDPGAGGFGHPHGPAQRKVPGPAAPSFSARPGSGFTSERDELAKDCRDTRHPHVHGH